MLMALVSADVSAFSVPTFSIFHELVTQSRMFLGINGEVSNQWSKLSKLSGYVTFLSLPEKKFCVWLDQ